MTLRLRSISPLGLLALAACKSGDGATGGLSTSAGVAVKGPLGHALAFVDTNGNHSLDAGETSGFTDASGNYALANPTGAQIVIQAVEGTIDGSTGLAIRGVTMFGSADATLITPITTLAESGVDMTAFASAIGLDGVDLLTFNPYGEGVDPAQALIAEKAAQQIVATLQVISGALVGGGNAADLTEGYTAAFNAMAEALTAQVANGGTISLDSALLSEIVVSAGFHEGSATALADQITAAFNAIDALDSLTGDAAVAAFTAGGSLAAIYEADYAAGIHSNFDEVLTNAAPTAIALTPVGATLSVDEVITPPASNVAIATIEATDDSTVFGGFDYALSGADASKFVLVGNEIFLAAGATLSAEEIASLNVSITVTDELGKSFTQAFEIAVNNVDEVTTGSATITGNGSVGTTLVISDTLADVDNTVDGGANGDFASKTYQWFAGGEAITGATSDHLNLTAAEQGKAITAVVTTVDQQGGAAVQTVGEFGTIAPDFAPLTLVVHAGIQQAIEAVTTAQEHLTMGMDQFSAEIADKMVPFTNGFSVSPDIAVSSTGIVATWGDYSIAATFANFAPTTLAELDAAISSFDQNDLSTLTISGGFSELAFSGPDGTLVKLELSDGDWNNGAADVLRIVNVDAATGDVSSIGLFGQFDGQIGTLMDVFQHSMLAENIPEPNSNDFDLGNGTYDWAALDAAWADYNQQVHAADLEGMQFLADHEQLQGGYVQFAGDSEAFLELDWGSHHSASPDEISLRLGDLHLMIAGDFPDSPADLGTLLSDTGPLAGFINGDGDYTTAELQGFVTGAASAGFSDVDAITLTQSVTTNGVTTSVPVFDLVIDNFASVIENFNAIDVDGQTSGTFTPHDTPVQMVSDSVQFIQDNDGMYLMIGDGVDLESLFGTHLTSGETLAA